VTPTSSNPHPFRFWRSPPDQPRWARPALLSIAVLAAVAYGWSMGNVTLEPFYGGAARSMSQNWHDFFFGALDPWGTISVDKLPGALWVQALSLRLFGFHLWAIVLPQVVEGTLTVLVLFRAVRRVAGAAAGLGAAVVLAASPVTLLLNRGNISDTLLILLLVLAADATTAAILEGRAAKLVVAGLWVGLAFQTKMIQAWLVLPALYLAYLLAAPTVSFVRRCGHIALSVLVVAVVSLSWMTAVSAIPAHDRPYVDGSCDNSLFSQVFLYNGLDRITGHELNAPDCHPQSPYLVGIARRDDKIGAGTFGIASGRDRLLKGVFGRDDAWFMAPSLIAAAALLLGRRRMSRTDPIRAATVLWTTWLIITGIFFSQGQYLNSYYVAALVPPMGALCGMGAAAAWRKRHAMRTKAVVAATVAISTAYGISLIPGYAGIHTRVVVSSLVVAAAAIALLLVSQRLAAAWIVTIGFSLSSVALLMGAVWASGSVLASGQGPFDTPYEPNQITFLNQTRPALLKADWPEIVAFANSVPANQAADVLESSAGAGYDIMVTGHEFLPVGGFTGRVPSPTIPQFERLVNEGRILRASVTVIPLTSDPVMLWITHHCAKQQFGRSTYKAGASLVQRYICSPDPVRSTRRAAAPTLIR
jgi:4-amino-4-deoxy-L-arabinose transferase-like glycosyltransferase